MSGKRIPNGWDCYIWGRVAVLCWVLRRGLAGGDFPDQKLNPPTSRCSFDHEWPVCGLLWISAGGPVQLTLRHAVGRSACDEKKSFCFLRLLHPVQHVFDWNLGPEWT